MTDFSKIEKMIDYISSTTLPKNQTFNEFALEFYLETRHIPLSKFLKLREFKSKTPKIMNTKKAGELLYETKTNHEALDFLSDNGFVSPPELNYTNIMLLRKTTVIRNWKKLITYIKGNGTIDQINKKNKKQLLPDEKLKLEEFLKEKLNLSSSEFDWLLKNTRLIGENKELEKAIKKLI